MNFMDKMERKFGKYAIPNLMYYIIILYIVGYILRVSAGLTGIDLYSSFLSLNFKMIFRGQVWRLVTFIIQPPNTRLLFIFFALYFYYMIGTSLERLWGSFRFNVYFFSGVIFNIIAALIIYLVWGANFELNTYFINLALFMAYAVEFPDMEVLLFFIIPIKIKWLGILDALFLAFEIIGGYAALIAYNAGNTVLFMRLLFNYGLHWFLATSALVAMINFFIFMLLTLKKPGKTRTQKNFRKFNKGMDKDSFGDRFSNARNEKTTWENTGYRPINPKGARHKCAICGRSELDGDLTFRYCSKCNGEYEYCQDHLYTHVHVK